METESSVLGNSLNEMCTVSLLQQGFVFFPWWRECGCYSASGSSGKPPLPFWFCWIYLWAWCITSLHGISIAQTREHKEAPKSPNGTNSNCLQHDSRNLSHVWWLTPYIFFCFISLIDVFKYYNSYSLCSVEFLIFFCHFAFWDSIEDWILFI